MAYGELDVDYCFFGTKVAGCYSVEGGGDYVQETSGIGDGENRGGSGDLVGSTDSSAERYAAEGCME